MQIQPYLFFEGRAGEAIEFYTKALGAKVVMIMRNNESPAAPPPEMVPPGAEKNIMHASLDIGGATLMLSDGMSSGKPEFKGVSLSLTLPDAAAADRAFNALLEGGDVVQPLVKTFFAERFGMLRDRFGVHWMVTTAA